MEKETKKKNFKKWHTTDIVVCHKRNSQKSAQIWNNSIFSSKTGEKQPKSDWMNERLQKYVILMSLIQNHYSRFVWFSIRWFGSLVCSSFRSPFPFHFFLPCTQFSPVVRVFSGTRNSVYFFFPFPRRIWCVLFLFSLFQCSRPCRSHLWLLISSSSLFLSLLLLLSSSLYHKRSENGITNWANLFRVYT